MGSIGPSEIFVLFIIFFPFYFLPTIIALFRKKSNRTAIFFLNFFLGWTFVGWIVSFVWACTADEAKTIVVNNTYSAPKNSTETNLANDKLESLKKLKELLDAGVLTQEEFDKEKAKILST